MNNKKTQRLYKLPFDPYAPGEYYDRLGGLRDQMRKRAEESPLIFWDRLWSWRYPVKRWIEPWYPTSIARTIKRFYQRRTRGFDYTEMWGLDYSLAKLIYPRLKEFHRLLLEEKIHGYPPELDPCWPHGCKWDYENNKNLSHEADIGYKKWQEIVGNMIYPFETLVLVEEDPDYNEHFMTSETHFQLGMSLFCKFFRALWD